jgi:hypothetical protein
MLPDLRHGMEGGPGVEAEWRAAASKLRDHVIARGAPVFIVTIFRHLPREQRDALPFLRRLNLMALRLSQEFGLFVIDLDRVLTHRGAIPIGADAWLLGDPARSVAGDAIVDVLLAAGVDHLFDDVALKRALSSQAAQRAGRPAHLSGE